MHFLKFDLRGGSHFGNLCPSAQLQVMYTRHVHRDTENTTHTCRCHSKEDQTNKRPEDYKRPTISLDQGFKHNQQSKLETNHHHAFCASCYIAKSQFSNACKPSRTPLLPPTTSRSMCTITVLTFLYLTSFACSCGCPYDDCKCGPH